MDKNDRLMSILDSFLEERKDELSGVNPLGAVPVDYVSAYLDTPDTSETAADNAIRTKTEQLLDAFLSTDHEKTVFAPSEEPDSDSPDADGVYDEEDDTEQLEDSYFTETLARIYLKQHRYDKSLEIIRSLYLNFPNKSIYFADQIRYLEKLVRINQKSK